MQRLIIIGILIGMAAPVWAAGAQQGWYVGAGFGASSTSADVDKDLVGTVNNCVADLGLARCSGDKRSSGYQLLVGYRLSPVFALEGGYVDLGDTVKFSTTDSGGVMTHEKQTTRGFKLVAVGLLPLRSRFSLGGKLGAFLWQSEASQRRDPAGSFPPNTVSNTGVGLTVGLRAGYSVSPRLMLSLDWDQYANLGKNDTVLNTGAVFNNTGSSLAQTVKVNASLFSLNLLYRFN